MCLTFITLVVSLTACASLTAKKSVTSQSNDSKSGKKHNLDYDDQKDWKFESGDSQSPINIDTAKVENMTDNGTIALNYATDFEKVVDNGHSIEAEIKGSAEINGRKYKLKQFHFHAPSDHEIDGKHFPLEVHFVNQAQDGRLAVIAAMFQEGEANATFQSILDHIDSDTSGAVALTDLLPIDQDYYHYNGSLTTPPLSENVEWYVMKHPVTLSSEQLKGFRHYYDDNNRKIQETNHRTILSHDD